MLGLMHIVTMVGAIMTFAGRKVNNKLLVITGMVCGVTSMCVAIHDIWNYFHDEDEEES